MSSKVYTLNESAQQYFRLHNGIDCTITRYGKLRTLFIGVDVVTAYNLPNTSIEIFTLDEIDWPNSTNAVSFVQGVPRNAESKPMRISIGNTGIAAITDCSRDSQSQVTANTFIMGIITYIAK